MANPSVDIPNDLVPADNVAAPQARNPSGATNDLVPASQVASDGSSSPDEPQIGRLESFGRGAEQMATLGYAPQINAEVENLLGNGTYQSNLAHQKTSQDAAWNQHPWLYGTGAAASVIPGAIGSVLTGGAPEEAAGAGLGAKALAALGSSSNLATLGSAALKGISGEGTTLASAGAKGVANLLGGTLAQGAIYGSSQGDTTAEKEKDAALGAVGGKLGEKAIGAGAYLGGEIGRGIYNKIFTAIAGDPTDGQVAADAAHQLGITVPTAALQHGPLTGAAIKLDPYHHVNLAAASTLGQTGDTIAQLHSNVLPEDAGGAIQDSFGDWLNGPPTPIGSTQPNSRGILNNIYSGISSLSGNLKTTPLTALQKVYTAASSDPDFSNAYAPTLNVVKQSLEDPNGLTFDRIRALRTAVSDKIDFNKLSQDKTLDQGLLGQMRDALTNDLYSAADNVGGPGTSNLVKGADATAAPIYKLRSFLNSKIGTDPKIKAPSTVFRNLSQMASVKNGDLDTLSQIKNIVPPDAWNQFSQGYLQQLAPPEGQFTFGNFNKRWNSISDPAKDLMFGAPGNGGARDVLENINTLGNSAGTKIDRFGLNPDTQNMWQTGEILGLGAEALQGNVGKAASVIAVASGAGKLAARNAAAPMAAPSARATFLANNPAIEAAVNKAANYTMPTLAGAAEHSAKQLGIYGVAKGAVNYADPAYRAALLGVSNLADKYIPSGVPQQPQASGGRITRASGGKATKKTHEELVQRLMNMAKRAKKISDKKTEPLLNVSDDRIVKALDVAQQAI